MQVIFYFTKKKPQNFYNFNFIIKSYTAVGGNVTLRCRPEGAPQPVFTWRKDGNVIGQGGKYIKTDNGNLFISRINADDGGLYTCEADNEMGM